MLAVEDASVLGEEPERTVDVQLGRVDLVDHLQFYNLPIKAAFQIQSNSSVGHCRCNFVFDISCMI